MSSDIIGGLVFVHMSRDPVLVQKLDVRATLLVFPEDMDVKRICTSLKSVDIQLGCSVTITCDTATPKQLPWLSN